MTTRILSPHVLRHGLSLLLALAALFLLGLMVFTHTFALVIPVVGLVVASRCLASDDRRLWLVAAGMFMGFAWFFWPTPYHVVRMPDRITVVNRLTGRVVRSTSIALPPSALKRVVVSDREAPMAVLGRPYYPSWVVFGDTDKASIMTTPGCPQRRTNGAPVEPCMPMRPPPGTVLERIPTTVDRKADGTCDWSQLARRSPDLSAKWKQYGVNQDLGHVIEAVMTWEDTGPCTGNIVLTKLPQPSILPQSKPRREAPRVPQ